MLEYESTRLAKQLRGDELPLGTIADLSAAYGVGPWLSCSRTPKGKTNVSFFVDTPTGRYVLRLSDPRKTVTALQFEIALIDYLRANGYPAPEIVRTRAGDDYLLHDGFFYVMSAFIAGEHYDERSPAHLREAARGLGRYHRIVAALPDARDWRLAPPLTNLATQGALYLGELDRFVAEFLAGSERAEFETDLAYVRGAVRRVDERLATVYSSLPKLVIHGSYGQSALLFLGDTVTGVLDYDRSALDIRDIDLAYTVKASCRDRMDRRGDFWVGYDFAACRAFMESYREEEPMSDEEALALPLIFAAQRLAKIVHKTYNFLAKNAVVPQEEKDVRKLATIIDREVVRVRWLEEHDDELTAALTNR